MLSDIVCVLSVLYGVLAVYRYFGGEYTLTQYLRFWPLALAVVVCNSFSRLYHGNTFYPGACLSAVEELRRLTFSCLLGYLLLFAYIMLTREAEMYSRFALCASLLLTMLLLPIFRYFMRSFMKHAGIGHIAVLLAGTSEMARKVAFELERDRYFGFDVLGFLADGPECGKIGKLEILGQIEDAAELGKRLRCDYLILCLPSARRNLLLEGYIHNFRHVLIIPEHQTVPISWTYPVDLYGFGSFQICNQLSLGIPRAMKTVSELFFTVLALIAAAPIFALLAFCVKISSRGPVFYRAERLGENGQSIKVLKFRTMYQDAEARLQDILAKDPARAQEWEQRFKLTEDPRITPLGGFLRKSSLDELPQLWNVLKREMNIIGPRPIVRDEVAYYGAQYDLLRRVKPGITGLWQVSGRSDTDYVRRVSLDVYYVTNWSFWLDYYILLKTVKEVILCSGAR